MVARDTPDASSLDLTGTSPDTAANIIKAVLTLANVPYTGSNIASTAVLYGTNEDAASRKDAEDRLKTFKDAGK